MDKARRRVRRGEELRRAEGVWSTYNSLTPPSPCAIFLIQVLLFNYCCYHHRVALLVLSIRKQSKPARDQSITQIMLADILEAILVQSHLGWAHLRKLRSSAYVLARSSAPQPRLCDVLPITAERNHWNPCFAEPNTCGIMTCVSNIVQKTASISQ